MKDRLFTAPLLTIIFICSLTSGCQAQGSTQDALSELRELARDGKMPAESVVAAIERHFAGTTTGVLAKLLRARVRFENKDYLGAAALLNSDEFEKKTSLGDYALWLRGKALKSAGSNAEAIDVLSRLVREHPDSVRIRDAKLLWAQAAMDAGKAVEVPPILIELTLKNDYDALVASGKAFDAQGSKAEALGQFRRALYVSGKKMDGLSELEKWLVANGYSGFEPQTAEEMLLRAKTLLVAQNYSEAAAAYTQIAASFPSSVTPSVQIDRLVAGVKSKQMSAAETAFNSIPATAKEKEQAYYELIVGFADAKQWAQARKYADEMRAKYPTGPLTVKAWVDAGYAARDAKMRAEESFFLQMALINYPAAVEVAGAQFELAWLEHEAKNHAKASGLLIEHLARYADKDTTNRGRAGYWSARNSELAGKIAEACTLYDATAYRYGANWYGHLSLQRIVGLRSRGQCRTPAQFPAGSLVPQAAANLKSVTVAPETSGPTELARAEKSEQLSTIGLFDWAIEELKEAKKAADNSPKINLALAKHYRFKNDNVNALLSLAKSYPDYAQMFPEEMSREEWEIFYPHVAWDEIRNWAKRRNLDIYQVAGLIRQESIFNPTVRSGANAYGLMQLLLPTARMMARKYGSASPVSSANDLYDPALNIELGTAYMRENLDKYGRIEYMAVAYNAGPGRVVSWRRTLPLEIDEFVEEIPFRETKGYVQGVIRNTAQYRRLYDENGNFKPNVGTKPVRAAIDSQPREQLSAEFPELIME